MKLIVIDPNVIPASPSMRAWLSAFPSFRHLFDEIEIWATACDVPEGDGVVWRRFPARLPHAILHAWDFGQRVSSCLKSLPETGDTIVQTTGTYVPRADIRYMHFWNRALLQERESRKGTFHLNIIHRIVAQLSARTEAAIARRHDSTSWWWVVSRSMADRIDSEAAGGSFRILPNQYDPARFNHCVRGQWRDPMRKRHGFSENERVLAFSAFGHFERKGLLQAIEAVNILQSQGYRLKLLVLGGTPKTLNSFQAQMSSRGVACSACVFTGLVDNIERHLSAADGLFFPSNFEAFSLAEIEAAALGLRLYLTPHYGVEMILRQPANGRLLPWDPPGMAAVIAEDLESGQLGTVHDEIGEAVEPREYRSRIVSLYEEVLATKR
ncbi:MAG: glycosyltransferase [Verrucomicrobiaceae bacterium]|nr:MAG: glycosyltransferase [Verrucomicrobiaceae bacterium]